MEQSFFGVIGLGVMGRSLGLNIVNKGFKLSVYNRSTAGEETMVSDFMKDVNSQNEVLGFTDLTEDLFCSGHSAPSQRRSCRRVKRAH